MVAMTLNKFWEWFLGAILAPIGMMFVNAGEYISIIIGLVLVDFLIGWIVKGWVMREKWSWRKFLLSVPVKILVACLLFPVLLDTQTKFNFLFDATKYVALTFSIALIASSVDNAGKAFGVDIKDKLIESLKSAIPTRK